MLKFLSVIVALLHVSAVSGGIIRLDNTGTGALLDDIIPADIGTADATVSVIEIPGLDLTVTGLATGAGSSAPILNSTGTSLGINATDDADTDAFEAAFLQSVTFQFSQAVTISQLDFTNFESGEVFDFAGVSIENDDLSNGTTDVFDFTIPLAIAANTNFTLQTTTGTIGIEAFDVTVTAVPEPSSVIFLGLGCAFGVGIRWRKQRALLTKAARWRNLESHSNNVTS